MPAVRPAPIICAALLLGALLLIAPAGAGARGKEIKFEQAKRELAEYAAWTCPTAECEHRTYDCRRRSALRVECRSETLENWEEENEKGERVVLWRELCHWIGVAIPYRGSTTRLKLTSRGFVCRRLKPGESWPHRT